MGPHSAQPPHITKDQAVLQQSPPNSSVEDDLPKTGSEEKTPTLSAVVQPASIQTRRNEQERKNCRRRAHRASTFLRLVVESKRLVLHTFRVFHRSFEVFEPVEFYQFLALEISKHMDTPEGCLE